MAASSSGKPLSERLAAAVAKAEREVKVEEEQERRRQQRLHQQQQLQLRRPSTTRPEFSSPRSSRSPISSGSPSPKRSSSAAASVRVSRPLPGLAEKLVGRSDHFAEFATILASEVQRLLRYTLLGYAGLPPEIEKRAQGDIDQGLTEIVDHLAVYIENAVEAVDSINAEIKDAATAWKTREGVPVVKLKDAEGLDLSLGDPNRSLEGEELDQEEQSPEPNESQPGESSESLESAQSVGTLVKKTSTVALTGQLDASVAQLQDLEKSMGQKETKVQNLQNLLRTLRFQYYSDIENQKNRFRKVMMDLLPDLSPEALQEAMNSVSAVKMFNLSDFYDEDIKQAVDRKATELQADFAIERDALLASIRTLSDSESSLRKQLEKEKKRADELEAELECSDVSDGVGDEDPEASQNNAKEEPLKEMQEEPSESQSQTKVRRRKSRDQSVTQEPTLNHSASITRDRAEFSRLMTENEVAGKRIQELAMHAAAMRDLASKYEIRVKTTLPQTEEHLAFVSMAQQVQGRAEKMTATVTTGEHALDEESKKSVLSRAETEVLRQDLADHKREVETLKKQKEQLEGDGVELRAQLETLTAKRQELQELCDSHDAEVHSLKEQVEKLRAVEAAKVENMRHARTTMKILNMVKKAKTEEDRETSHSEGGTLPSPTSLAPPSPRPANAGGASRSASKGSNQGQSPTPSFHSEGDGEEKVSAGDVDRLVSQLVADTVEKEKAWVREHMQREIDQIKMELWQVKEENFAILSERRQLRESVSRMSRLSRQSSLQTIGALEPLTPTGASASPSPSPQAFCGTGSLMANFPTSPAGNAVGHAKSMPSTFHNVPGILNNPESPSKKKRGVTYEDEMGPKGSKLHILVPDQDGNVVNMAAKRSSDSSDSTSGAQPAGEVKSEGRRDSGGSAASEEWVQAVPEELEAIPEIETESVAVQCGDVVGRSRIGPHDLNLVCRLGPPGFTDEPTHREVSEFATTEAQTESVAEVSLRLGATIAEGCQTEEPQPRGIAKGAQTEEQHIPLNLPSQGPEALRRRLSSMKSTVSGGMSATATGGKRSSMKRGSMERTASSKERNLTSMLSSGLATPPPAVNDATEAALGSVPEAGKGAGAAAGSSSGGAAASPGSSPGPGGQGLKTLNAPPSPALSSLSGDLGPGDVDLGDAEDTGSEEPEATVFSEEDVARMMKLVQLECENEMRGQLLNQREKLVKAWPRAMSEGAISRRISADREKDKQVRRQQETGRRRLNLRRDKPLEAEIILFRDEVEEERQKALQGIDAARLLLYTNDSSLDARVDDLRHQLESEDFVSRWQALGTVQKTTQAFKRDFDRFKERIKAVHFEADRLRAHLGMTRDELLKKTCDSAMLFRLQSNWLRKCARMLEKFGVSTGVPSVLLRKSFDESTLEVAMREQLAEDSLHTAETAQLAFEERLERLKSVAWHRVYPDFRKMSLAHQREAFRIADSLVEFHLSLNKITRSIPDDDLEEVRVAIRTDPEAGLEPYMSKMIKDLVEKGMDVAIGHSTPQQIEAAMSVLCRVDLREQEIHRNYSESLGALDFCSIIEKTNPRFRRPFDELVSHGRRACDKFDMYEELLNPDMGETATTVHDDKLDFEFSDGEGEMPASPVVASGYSSEDPNHAINITTSASRMRQRIWKSVADTQSPSHWARSLTSMVSEATENDRKPRQGGSGDSQHAGDSDTDQEASEAADSIHEHISWRHQTRHSMQRKSLASSSSRGSEVCDLGGGASPRGGGYETVDEDSAEDRDHSSASASSASPPAPQDGVASGHRGEGRRSRRRKLSRSQSQLQSPRRADGSSSRALGEGHAPPPKETKSSGTMTEEVPEPVPLPTESAINAASAAAIKHLGEQQLGQVQQMQDFLQWQQELPPAERMPEADFKQMVGAVMNDLRDQEEQQLQCLEGLDLDLPNTKTEQGQQLKAVMSHLESERQRQAALQSQLEKQHAEQQARAQFLENQRQAIQQQIQEFKQKQNELEENSAEWRFQQQFDARQLHQQAQQLQMQERQRQQKDHQQQQLQQQLLQEKDEQQQKLLQQQQQMQQQEQLLKEQLQKHQQQQLLEKDHHEQMLQQQERLLKEKEELLKWQSELQEQQSHDKDVQRKSMQLEQEELLRRQQQELQEKERLLQQQKEERQRQQEQYQLLQQQQQQLQQLQQQLQQQQQQQQPPAIQGPGDSSRSPANLARLSIPIPELSSVELTRPAPAPLSSMKSQSSTLLHDEDSEEEEALSAEELAEKTRLEEQQHQLQRGLQDLQDQQQQLQQQREQLRQQREALQQQELQQQALQQEALQRSSSPQSLAGQRSTDKPGSAAASLSSAGLASPLGSTGPMSMPTTPAAAAGGAAGGTDQASLDPEAAAKLAAEAHAEQERLAAAKREFEQQHQALRDQERRLLETEKRMQKDWHDQQDELHKLMKEAEKQHARLQAAKADAPKKEKKHRKSKKDSESSNHDRGSNATSEAAVAESSGAASASDPYQGPSASANSATSMNSANSGVPGISPTSSSASPRQRSTLFDAPGLAQGVQSPSQALTPRHRTSVTFNLPSEEQDRLAQAPNQDGSGRQSSGSPAPSLRQAVLLMKAGSLMENASGEEEASKPKFAAYLEKMAQHASLKGLLNRKSGAQASQRSSGGGAGAETEGGTGKGHEAGQSQATGGMNPLAYLMLQRKLKAGVTVEVGCQTEDSLPPRSRARTTATLAEEAANVAVARMLQRAEEEEPQDEVHAKWDDSDSRDNSKDSDRGGPKVTLGPGAAAARLARVRSKVNNMSRLLKRGQSDRNLDVAPKVAGTGQQCELVWEDLPHRVIQWLRTNLYLLLLKGNRQLALEREDDDLFPMMSREKCEMYVWEFQKFLDEIFMKNQNGSKDSVSRRSLGPSLYRRSEQETQTIPLNDLFWASPAVRRESMAAERTKRAPPLIHQMMEHSGSDDEDADKLPRQLGSARRLRPGSAPARPGYEIPLWEQRSADVEELAAGLGANQRPLLPPHFPGEVWHGRAALAPVRLPPDGNLKERLAQLAQSASADQLPTASGKQATKTATASVATGGDEPMAAEDESKAEAKVEKEGKGEEENAEENSISQPAASTSPSGRILGEEGSENMDAKKSAPQKKEAQQSDLSEKAPKSLKHTTKSSTQTSLDLQPLTSSKSMPMGSSKSSKTPLKPLQSATAAASPRAQTQPGQSSGNSSNLRHYARPPPQPPLSARRLVTEQASDYVGCIAWKYDAASPMPPLPPTASPRAGTATGTETGPSDAETRRAWAAWIKSATGSPAAGAALNIDFLTAGPPVPKDPVKLPALPPNSARGLVQVKTTPR